MNEILEKAEELQNLLVSKATGGKESDKEYIKLRNFFIKDNVYSKKLPKFIRTCRNLDQFWQFIKYESDNYAGRRAYIWEHFQELISHLEHSNSAFDTEVSLQLEQFDAEHVNEVWRKSLERKNTDPEGAITAARTLIESVCKFILDEKDVKYNDGEDLPKLYKQVSTELNLAPSQHTEQIFKQILSGCISTITGLGSLRNKISDAHGKGKTYVKPSARHAELMVNLAGSLASFLLQTASKDT